MKGALKIATAFNIPVYVHWSFGLIVGYVLYDSISNGDTATATIWSVVLILGLFFCVVLHEYGHALAARRYGVGTKNIVLYPIGGVALLERMPKKPLQELIVAIAGPLVNVLIIILLSPYFLFTSWDEMWDKISSGNSAETIIPLLIIMNGILIIFNMIPAFPMDGGRVFRALLSMKFNRVRATLVAARIGQLFGALFIYLGVTSDYFGPTFALIGLFVIVMANNEYKSVKSEEVFAEGKVSNIMRKEFTKFLSNDPIYIAANELDKGKEHSFLVYNIDDILIGVLEEKSIKQAIRDGRTGADISNYMNSKIVAVDSQTSIGKAHSVFLDGNSIIVVLENQEIVGVVDTKGMVSFLKEKGIR